MALPKIDLPLYSTTVPSTGQKTTYRPFLVKEEKILLMALEGGVEEEIHNATLQIIQNCVADVDVEKLSSFDVEWLFLQIRIRSIGEKTTLRFKHKNGVNKKGEDCKHIQEVDVDLTSIQIQGEIKPPVIMLTDTIGMKMRFPTMRESLEISRTVEGGKVERTLETVRTCIEMIFDGEEMYPAKDSTKEELQEFLDGLNSEQFKKIQDFFLNMPRLKQKLTYTCEKCGEVTRYPVEGLSSFFA